MQGSGPTRQQRATRTYQLRQRGYTWDQIADIWVADHPEITLRRAYRWAHNLTHDDVARRWNESQLGEPTMTKARIYQFEAWPNGGRRPTVQTLQILAGIFQTSARALITDYEYGLYNEAARAQIDNGAPRREGYSRHDSPVLGPTRIATAPRVEYCNLPRGADSLVAENVVTDSHNPDMAAMHAFRAADSRVGGAHLYANVIDYLQSDLAPRLFSTFSDEADTVFLAATALTEMAGWMAHDSGRDRLAGQHFARALAFTRSANDGHLTAHVLSSMSHLASHLQSPGEAIRLAIKAQDALNVAPPSSALKARLLAMEARGFAGIGDADTCRTLLKQAARELETPSSEPPSQWVSNFDEGSLASESARCMWQLGNLTEMRYHAERVISSRPSHRTRSRAFGQLTLASALLGLGKTDEACAVAHEVVASTRSIGSFLVIKQLSRFRQSLVAVEHDRSRMILELMELLHVVLEERLKLYNDVGNSSISGEN